MFSPQCWLVFFILDTLHVPNFDVYFPTLVNLFLNQSSTAGESIGWLVFQGIAGTGIQAHTEWACMRLV